PARQRRRDDQPHRRPAARRLLRAQGAEGARDRELDRGDEVAPAGHAGRGARGRHHHRRLRAARARAGPRLRAGGAVRPRPRRPRRRRRPRRHCAGGAGDESLPTERFRLRLAVLVLALAACAAAIKTVPLAAPCPSQPGGYDDAYERWTRRGEDHYDLIQTLTVSATLQSPEFRAAYVRERTERLGLSPDETAQLDAGERAAADAGWDVELLIATSKPE